MVSFDPLDPAVDPTLVVDVLRQVHGAVRDVHLASRPLRGGLVSDVALVTARFVDPRGRPGRHAMVVKTLKGPDAREAGVYARVLRGTDLAPRPLRIHRASPDRLLLFLEVVRRRRGWPWREVDAARRVLERAALVHELAVPAPVAERLARWDYDAELVRQGSEAVELLERGDRSLRRGLPPLRRLVERVPAVRRALADFGPLRPSLLHGDLHSGNVIVPAATSSVPVVFVDWGRARVGSPLEDVSSWLHSLGCWEPVARKRHDTLLAAYLAARGQPATLTTDLRSAYWLASACNALAGALAHHLRIAGAGRGTAAAVSLDASRRWLRVVRRADASWRS